MRVYHNSWKSCYKTPFGALPQEKECTISLSIKDEKQDIKVYIIIYKDGMWEKENEKRMEMKKEDNGLYSINVSFEEIGYYFYYFEVDVEDKKLYIVKDENNEAIISSNTYHKWQITVYDKLLDSKKTGLENLVMYQIFPDSFYREEVIYKDVPKDRRIIDTDFDLKINDEQRETLKNNTYYGGNIKGIIKKLKYLENLGVNIIYLNPIFEAHSNHRYNTANFMNIDSLLGSNDDFIQLCKEAHKRNMYIIIDGVFNHVGADSIYFNKLNRYSDDLGAYNSKASKYYSFFKNSFINYPNDYKGWWGDPKGLPEIDKSSPEYIEYICGKNGVIKTWLDRGADGFRLDVIDELPNHFIDILCKSIREYGGKIIIGEVWEDATDKFDKNGNRRKYLLGNQIDSVMNYPFTNNAIEYIKTGNNIAFYNNIMQIMDHYPKHSINLMMNLLSTHDIERVRNRLANEGSRVFSKIQKETSKELLKLLFVMQYTIPGIPCIYYGDEKGMFGRGNLENRKYMQWENEESDLKEILINLALFRRENSLIDACFEIKYIDSNILIYSLKDSKKEILVFVNRTKENYNTNEFFKIDTGYKKIFCIKDSDIYNLKPLDAMILKKQINI